MRAHCGLRAIRRGFAACALRWRRRGPRRAARSLTRLRAGAQDIHDAHVALDAARAAVTHAAAAAASKAKPRGGKAAPASQTPAKRTLSLAAVQTWPRATRLLIAGAVAGGVSKTATAPIELVRMKVMVGAKAAGAGGKAMSVGEVIATTWQAGGWTAFFKGNAVNVARTIPSKSIQFAAFDAYKRVLQRKNKKTGATELPPWGASAAGALAGVTSTVICHPLETLQTRLAVGAYKGVGDALTSIVAKEGPKALFGGLGPSIVGIIPYSGFNLGAYDGMRWAYTRVTGQERIPKGTALVMGAFAGVTAATATFPLEVVRRRMMMGAVAGNTLQALSAIANAEGVGALFAGCSLNYIKVLPSSGLSIFAYEACKEALLVK